MQLKLLWNLQELDLSIIDLQNKIAEMPFESGIKETTARLKELEEIHAGEEKGLDEDRKNFRKLEMKTQKIAEDRSELADSLYGGKVTNVKELEQMQRKVDLLDAEKKKLEDEMLVLMESIENREEKLEETAEKIKDCRRELEEKEKALENKLQELNKELAGLETERKRLAEQIDEKLMTKYEYLAEKYGGMALAAVTNDICGGCRVFISSAQRGHLYNPGAMVYCENCGRLLVKFD